MKHHCPYCSTETEHTHTHQAPYGLAGAHMSGSEQFCCLRCEKSTFASDPYAEQFPFVLDKLVRSATGKPTIA